MTKDNELQVWGENYAGCLGKRNLDYQFTGKPTPFPCPSCPETSRIVSVATGGDHTLLLNSDSQIVVRTTGLGNMSDTPSPVLLPAFLPSDSADRVVKIRCGVFFSGNHGARVKP
jgi:hypothetical protein